MPYFDRMISARGILPRSSPCDSTSLGREAATRLLRFLKSTQNCESADPGLRGGIKGAFPFDRLYGSRVTSQAWACYQRA